MAFAWHALRRPATALIDLRLFKILPFTISALITFVIIAAVIFFLVVKPVNALMARLRRGEE